MITRKLISDAVNANLIAFEKSPDGGEVVCRIGEFWFYFAGSYSHDENGHIIPVYDPKTYVKNNSKEEIVTDIFETLDYFKYADELKDECEYYELVLRNRLYDLKKQAEVLQ